MIIDMVDGRYHHLPLLDPAAMAPPMNTVLITEETQMELVRSFLARVDYFGLDVETNVTETFFDRRIRTIQLGNREEQYVIDLLSFCQRAGVKLYDAQAPSSSHFPPLIPPLGEPHSCFAPVLDVIRPALCSNSHLKVGQNLEFEYIMLKWCFGFRIWHLYGIDDAEKILYAGKVNMLQAGFWAMDDIVSRYMFKGLDKGLQKSFDLETPLTPDQVIYAALDTRLPLPIRDRQLLLLKKDGLMDAAQIEFDAIPAFGDLHLNGFILNKDRWMEKVEKIRTAHKENVKRLDTFFIPVVGTKVLPSVELESLENSWRNLGVASPEEKAAKGDDKKVLKEARTAARNEARAAFYSARGLVGKIGKLIPECEGDALINYGSNKQLREALLGMKGFNKSTLPSTDDEVLKKHAGKPVIDALRDFRETQKSLDQYGEEFLESINPFTGRIHADFRRMGAHTGRSACSNPNLQNLPKDPEVRACFEAAPGCLLATVDMNGAELRIIADYGQIKTWIDAFNKGWDVHSVSTEILYPTRWPSLRLDNCSYYTKDHQKCSCPEHKKLRDATKSCNFLLAYGGGPSKLASEIGVTMDEAKAIMRLHESKFPDVWGWLSTKGRIALTTLESRTMAGRRRLYTRPTFDIAREKVIKDIEKKKDKNRICNLPTQNEVLKKMGAMSAGIEREGKNSGIQGSNSDFAKKAMGCGFDKNKKPFLWHLMEPRFGARFVNFVHDELIYEQPEHCAKEAFDTVADAIRRAGAEYFRSLVMEADGNIDKVWKK